MESDREPMWFFDEEGEEWQNFRKEAQDIEQEHLRLRVALRDAEAALRTDPGSEDLQARVQELKKKLEEMEKKAPWISAEYPLEVLLWGVPHG